jgi:hypothetical protein
MARESESDLIQAFLLQAQFRSCWSVRAANGSIVTLWTNFRDFLMTEDLKGHCTVYQRMNKPYSAEIIRLAVRTHEPEIQDEQNSDTACSES